MLGRQDRVCGWFQHFLVRGYLLRVLGDVATSLAWNFLVIAIHSINARLCCSLRHADPICLQTSYVLGR